MLLFGNFCGCWNSSIVSAGMLLISFESEKLAPPDESRGEAASRRGEKSNEDWLGVFRFSKFRGI